MATQEKFISPDGLSYLIQRLKGVFDQKVDKQTGYSLISDTEATRLASVVNYDDSEVKESINTLDGSAIKAIKVNNTALTAQENTVNIAVPTKVSELQNDSSYLTAVPAEYITETELTNKDYITTSNAASTFLSKTDASSTYATAADVYTKTEIDTKIKGGVHAKGTVATYADLPTNAQHGDMYNVTAADPDHGIKAGDNVVFLVVNEEDGTGVWDNYGGIVDTSGLVSKSDAITNEEIDQIWTNVMG